MSIQLIILFLSFILAGQVAFCQSRAFQFRPKVASGNFYLLKGTIDGRHKITMKLDVLNSARCGAAYKSIQFKNGGIDGWYEYDRIGERIPITGSFLNGEEVKLFVPNSVQDTINGITCEMVNFKEMFWNDEDFDVIKMQWKQQDVKGSKEVRLTAFHTPVEDTMFLEFIVDDEVSKVINVSDLTDVSGIDNIEVISYSSVDSIYHLLFRLENNGWREYQDYIGYLSMNKDLQLKEFYVVLRDNSWSGESATLFYDEYHPERGVKRL